MSEKFIQLVIVLQNLSNSMGLDANLRDFFLSKFGGNHPGSSTGNSNVK